MAVREVVDARGNNSSTGEGAAKTEVAAANAAIALKVFILEMEVEQLTRMASRWLYLTSK